MVIGWNILTPESKNDEEVGSVGQAVLVDKRLEESNQDSNQIQLVITTGESIDSLAKEKKIGTKLHIDAVKAEQRVRFLKNLSMLGVGTN